LTNLQREAKLKFQRVEMGSLDGGEHVMTVKKVFVVLGSPRKEANSTILAQKAADGARDTGADVELL
jgi:hypothetical protein